MGLAELVHIGSWRERRREREVADSWILRNGVVPSRFAWRAAELTSPHERRLLARSLRGVVSDLSPARMPGPAPLNRVALRPHADELTELAARLDDLHRPVSARGILNVHWLLVDSTSPFYARPDNGLGRADVPAALATALHLLEVDP